MDDRSVLSGEGVGDEGVGEGERVVEVVEESMESDDEVKGVDSDRAGEFCFGADRPGRRGIQCFSSGRLDDMSAHRVHRTWSLEVFRLEV